MAHLLEVRGKQELSCELLAAQQQVLGAVSGSQELTEECLR